MKHLITVFVFVLVLTCAQTASATVIDLTLTPDYPAVDGLDATGVTGDAPTAEWGTDSWQALGNNVKSQIYFTPTQFFGSSIKLGDIASMSYWTKNDTSHIVSAGDWYLQIYTSPLAEVDRWYGYRVTAEPYFASNLTETPGEWVQWSTDSDDDTNELRFFDNTVSPQFTDPLWDEYLTGDAINGETLADLDVMYITLATGSPWYNGFDGFLDGLTISLTNGDIVNVNFEASAPVPEPSTFLLLFAGLGGLAFLRMRRKA